MDATKENHGVKLMLNVPNLYRYLTVLNLKFRFRNN